MDLTSNWKTRRPIMMDLSPNRRVPSDSPVAIILIVEKINRLEQVILLLVAVWIEPNLLRSGLMAILHLGISNNSQDYTHLSTIKHHLTMTQIHNFLVFLKETYLVSETMISNKKNKLFTGDVTVICRSGSLRIKIQRETDLLITKKTIKINWMIPRVILCITKKLMRKL